MWTVGLFPTFVLSARIRVREIPMGRVMEVHGLLWAEELGWLTLCFHLIYGPLGLRMYLTNINGQANCFRRSDMILHRTGMLWSLWCVLLVGWFDEAAAGGVDMVVSQKELFGLYTKCTEYDLGHLIGARVLKIFLASTALSRSSSLSSASSKGN